jgi:hypothetical protein
LHHHPSNVAMITLKVGLVVAEDALNIDAK